MRCHQDFRWNRFPGPAHALSPQPAVSFDGASLVFREVAAQRVLPARPRDWVPGRGGELALGGKETPKNLARLIAKLDFKRVEGTTEFHILVFKPFQKFFHASNVICVCENCMNRKLFCVL